MKEYFFPYCIVLTFLHCFLKKFWFSVCAREPEPKPNTRTVFDGDVVPLYKGSGNSNLICGNCRARLIEGTTDNQFRSDAIRCPNCELFNDASALFFELWLHLEYDARIDPGVIFDLFEASNLNGRQQKDIAEGVFIQFEPLTLKRVFGCVRMIEKVDIAIHIDQDLALPIAASALSKYLYDKLKDNGNIEIEICNIPIEINAQKIERLINFLLGEVRERVDT